MHDLLLRKQLHNELFLVVDILKNIGRIRRVGTDKPAYEQR